jgi:hypothetical protein
MKYREPVLFAFQAVSEAQPEKMRIPDQLLGKGQLEARGMTAITQYSRRKY